MSTISPMHHDNGTVADLWPLAVERGVPTPAMVVSSGAGWREVTWEEADTAVTELAAGFRALGVEPGDRVALLLSTDMDWVVSDHALMAIGAVVVPVYPTSSLADAAHILNDSGSRLLVAEPLPLTDRLLRARSELFALETVVGVGDLAGADIDLARTRSRGAALLASEPDTVALARRAVRPEHLMTIVYTSGTTGPPKGCMLSHANFRQQVEMIVEAGIVRSEDRTVLHLPMAHVLARVIELMCARLSLTLGLCAETARLTSALAEVEPTVFVSVPRLFETAHRAVGAKVEASGALRRRLGRWAVAAGLEAYRASQRGRASALTRARGRVGDRLVLSRVRERMGGQLRLAISGGAALPGSVAEFFSAAGIPILEGYGLTEASGVVSVNDPARNVPGTVGIPLPRSEVSIARDGEILVRGPHVFQGYWGNEEATQAVLERDGWLRTGDVGRIDGGGRVVLVDRKKDIIVTAGGKNVSPQNIETALCASPAISQALVVGAERPVIGALVVPDREAIGEDAPAEEVARRVSAAIAEVNRGLGIDSRVRRHEILDREFDPDRGEVTPTLKVRRRVCEEHFAAEIERMYEERSA